MPAPAEATTGEDALRALIDGMGAVAWEADPKTRALRVVGRGVEGLLGFPAERWLDEPGLWASRLHVDDRAVAMSWRERCFRTGKGGAFEYRLTASDGRVVWVLETISVEAHEGGEAGAVRGVMIDIGRRKKTERRLYAARRELSDRLADSTYLDELTDRLVGEVDPRRIVGEALTAVMAIVGAEQGLVRLRGQRDASEVVESIGLNTDELSHLGRVGAIGPCSPDAVGGKSAVFEDFFDGPPHAYAAEAGQADRYRSAFGVCLRGDDGEWLGAVTVFFREAHRPTVRQVELVDGYAARASRALAVAFRHRAACGAERCNDASLAALAHELRTRLATIQMSAHAVSPDVDATAAEARDAILRQVGEMARLIDDLVDTPGPTR